MEEDYLINGDIKIARGNSKGKGVYINMSLKKQWLISIVMILLSWSSLPFLGKHNIKRFLPASLLVVLFEAINVQIVKKKAWWIFYNKPHSYLSGEFPFNIGPFLVSALWLLKSSFGNFKKFILLNVATHAFFAFVYIRILEKIKIARLVRINHFQFFLYFFYKSFFLYGFQYMIERIKKFKSSTVVRRPLKN